MQENIKIVHGLVGKRHGAGKISELEFNATNSIFGNDVDLIELDFVDLEQAVAVDVDIDLLKCDIEGAEQLFLENYPDLLKRVQAAVFELHPHLCDTDKCIQILENSGLANREVLRTAENFKVIYFWR